MSIIDRGLLAMWLVAAVLLAVVDALAGGRETPVNRPAVAAHYAAGAEAEYDAALSGVTNAPSWVTYTNIVAELSAANSVPQLRAVLIRYFAVQQGITAAQVVKERAARGNKGGGK